jgi:hypothetical protein
VNVQDALESNGHSKPSRSDVVEKTVVLLQL